jgi:type IV pilus assembly protein PilV
MLRSTETASGKGFTLLETLVALFVLAVGVLATAVLAGRTMSTGRQSKYMSLATTLASEKLEDLSRWDFRNPNVCVQSTDTSEGSITSDTAAKAITCPTGASGTVAYYDWIYMNTTGSSDCPNTTYGCFMETVYNSTNSNYATVYHSPDGTITLTSSTTAPTSSGITFDRRWVIEANPVVNTTSGTVTLTGSRRITVYVLLMDATVQPPVSFQMSTIRP